MKDWFYNSFSNEQLRSMLEDRTRKFTGKEIKIDTTLGRCSLAREHERLDSVSNSQR